MDKSCLQKMMLKKEGGQQLMLLLLTYWVIIKIGTRCLPKVQTFYILINYLDFELETINEEQNNELQKGDQELEKRKQTKTNKK